MIEQIRKLSEFGIFENRQFLFDSVSGILLKIENKQRYRNACGIFNISLAQTITLSDIQSVMYFLAIGLALSFIILLYELLLYHKPVDFYDLLTKNISWWLSKCYKRYEVIKCPISKINFKYFSIQRLACQQNYPC